MRLFKKKLKASYNINAKHYEKASVNGADVWGTDWLIPVAEKLDWELIEAYNHKQYLITKLTDYILWFIPWSYDEYIVEMPEGTYDFNKITHKDVVSMIYDCEHWNQGDKLEPVHGYDSVAVLKTEGNEYYTLGDNDYDLMTLKGYGS